MECQVAEKSRKLKPTTILFFYKGKIFETTDAQLCCVDQADKGKKIGLCTETTLTTLSCIFFLHMHFFYLCPYTNQNNAHFCSNEIPVSYLNYHVKYQSDLVQQKFCN